MKHEFEILKQTRRNFLALLEGHSLATLNHIPGGFNNNLIWNFGHAIVSTQLLVYRPAGLPMHIDDVLIEKYRRGSKPDGKLNNGEVEQLRRLAVTTDDLLVADYASGKFVQFEPFKSAYGVQLNTVEDGIRFAAMHEALHYGYTLALKRMLG
jgi:DinB superfamily